MVVITRKTIQQEQRRQERDLEQLKELARDKSPPSRPHNHPKESIVTLIDHKKTSDLNGEPVLFEVGDKVLIRSEERLATVLDVYGDGVGGNHGDIRLDVSGNTQIIDIEKYDAAKHAQYDHTFVPICAEWIERYGITQEVPLRATTPSM